MSSTISRTYGKKALVKRKTSPSDDDENAATKRRRVTPSEDEQEVCPNSKPKTHSPSPSPTKPAQAATPTKITKRMLGRSRTESSIENQTSSSTMASRTSSLPVISSPSSQTHPPPDDHSHDLLLKPTLTASASTPHIKRTYAGHSRSFLVSLPVSDLNPNALPGLDLGSQEDDFYEPESYSSLRLRWGVDNSEDDPATTPSRPNLQSKSKSKSKSSKSNSTNGTPMSKKGKGKASKTAETSVYLPPNMMNPLKSITELRSKGESRRFLDEVGYLFEGMDPSNSAGLKRSSASEITAKLCDDEFARKAKAADFYHKTWDVFLKAGAGKGEDKILDILLIFLLALIARSADTLLDLATQESSINKRDTESNSKGKGKQKAADTDIDVEHMDTLISILFFILKTSADVDPLSMISQPTTTDLDFKRIGLSKKDKTTLSNIHSTISTKSNLFPSKIPITAALLTTHILTHLPPSLLPTHHLPDLLHSLRSLIHTSFPPNEPFDGRYPPRDDNSVTELSSDSNADGDDRGEGSRGREPQYECIKHHLNLLDMYLLGQWSSSSAADDGGRSGAGKAPSTIELDKARDEWFVDGLIAIGVCSEIKLHRQTSSLNSSSLNDPASECLEILLRVFVNLTHDDSSWAQSVISNEFSVAFTVRLILMSLLASSSAPQHGKIKVENDEIKPKLEDDDDDPQPAASSHYQQSAWDRLCLALGLLTNLVQSVSEFKNVLRRTKVSTKCTLSNPTCTKNCTCPSSSQIGALEVLVRVYNTYSPPSTSAPHSYSHPSSSTTTVNKKRSKSPSKPIKRESSSSPIPTPVPRLSVTGAEDGENTSTSLILSTLSILFGLLISSSPQNQSIILSSIEGVDDEKIKLERLVSQAKEFVLLYDDAVGSGQDGGGGGGSNEGGEMRNAKEVMRVLEQLRDNC